MRRLLPLLLLAGCDFYFGGDDDPCAKPDIGGYDSIRLRDPFTGVCVDYGYGGGYCDDACGLCPAIDLAPLPSYGACESSCTGLSEQACLAAAGCQAAYIEDAKLADAPSITTFSGCWAVAPAPIPDSSCWDRDAYSCAADDTCAAYYTPADDALYGEPWFSRCAPEPTLNGCEDVDCGFNSHCELQCAPCWGPEEMCPCAPTCVPDYNTCAATDCGPGYTCVERCSGDSPTSGGAMPPWHCTTECVWTGGGEPGACTGDALCDALPPACPAGTVAGILNSCWSGYCIPVSACGPSDPGSCEPATCEAVGPACPEGTVGGTLNGCWTGYCIPASACPQVACEQLTVEDACTARADCQPIYNGANCTCDPGCTCEELTFDRCASTPMPF